MGQLPKFNTENEDHSHTGIAPIESFSGQPWDNYVKNELKNWQELYTYFPDNYPLHQIHILRFEYLKSNLEVELRHLKDFLGLKFDKHVVECIIKKQDGSFKRPKPDVDLKQFYTIAQRKSIEESRNLVYKRLGIN